MKYVFYCEHCNYKKYSDGTDVGDLKFVPSTPVQLNIPVYDPKEKKTVPSKFREQPKKIKCPKCGRTIVVKKNNVPTSTIPTEQPNHNNGSESGPSGLSIP